MKKKILLIFFVFGFGSVFCQTNLPEVIATSGGYFKPSASTPSLSWSIGECITETFSTTNNVLTQGFQQSHYNITAINEITEKDLLIKVFPNPSTDFISVSISSPTENKFNYIIELYNLQEKIVYTANYNKNEFQINMQSYSVGTYILRILNQYNKTIQNLKIQKIN